MRLRRTHLFQPLLLASLALVVTSSARPQDNNSPRELTADEYARAEKFMGYNTNPLVDHAVRPAWTSDERLWYRDTDATGARFVIFDPATFSKTPAFDHAKLAAALSAAAGQTYEAGKLPFREIELSADGQSVSFNVGRRRFQCDRGDREWG